MEHKFQKFITPELKGAKKKEFFKSEKRKFKEELRAEGEAFRLKKKETAQNRQSYTSTENAQESDKKNHTWEKSTKHEKNFSDSLYKKDRSRFVKKYQPPVSNSDMYFKGNRNQQSLTDEPDINVEGVMPLNKFIAYTGICGRREAALLVKKGLVKLNEDTVYEPGLKVSPNDKIYFNGKQLFLQKNLVYIILNKPKDCITTAFDPEGRNTVIDIVKDATPERLFPVGRLDRNTTGVLLMTNDGELAQKLTHPSFLVKKAYTVKLDKALTKQDFENILKGVNLEDGFTEVDGLEFLDLHDRCRIGISLHSGKNHIVKRIFEHFGYQVKALDRILFANLVKTKIQRGQWRFLTQHEIRNLKFFNKAFIKNNPKLIN